MKKIITTFLKCEICDTHFLTVRDRNVHIKSAHSMSVDDYIIKCYFGGNVPMCKCGCGSEVSYKFNKNILQWSEYVRNHFPRKPHSEATKKLIADTTKKSIQKKYGVDNVFALRSIQNKIKQTNQLKYGVDNPMQNPIIAERATHSHTQDTILKIKQTNLEKYGAVSYTASDIGKDRIKQSNIEKYGTDNPAKLKQVIDKIKQTNLQKYNSTTILTSDGFRAKYNSKNSKIERDVCIAVNGEHKFLFANKEFDIRVGNDIFEIDGAFWHPSTIDNLTFSQLNSIINDFQKSNLISNSKYSLYRIYITDIPDIITVKSLKSKSYIPDYSISNDTIIVSKQYLQRYLEMKGDKKLRSNIPLLLRFIRTFATEFPYPKCKQSAEEVVTAIANYDSNRIYNNNTFLNNSSNIGVSFLKERFKSYWKSKYKGNKSPIDVWYNDDDMKRIIEYRIGINNSGEVFDFSLKQLVQGISARRYTISFFKPVLAAAIYKKLLGDLKSPTVFDPCAGFGGRLLGFKSAYPSGTYIGIEPNPDTYYELQSLVDECGFTNVKLYNTTLELFTDNIDYDILFTSIPYFDREIYSNSVDYADFSEWKSLFLEKIFSYQNSYINMSQTLYDNAAINNIIWGNIQLNTSHFNKNTNIKHELIVTG